MTAQELQACPFCGGECFASSAIDEDVSKVFCDMRGCLYESGEKPNRAEAAAAHNTLCRKVAMHGELVELLRTVDEVDQDDARAWLDDRDALLTRARELGA